MPIFDFKCSECKEVMEHLCKSADPQHFPNQCPKCGAEKKLEKQLSSPSFQLNGGGWFSDGYTKDWTS